jgi:tetratricopeptide (TPR) repeat protein
LKLSKLQVIAFFLVLLVLTWFLYPRELFLAMIYEGMETLEMSESQYLKYLKKNPFQKFATLRLAQLYYRMAQPEKSTELLKSLYKHRYLDWEVAHKYLDHLDAIHEEEILFQARLEVARNFKKARRLHPAQIEEILQDALDYAIFAQKSEEAYQILEELLDLGRNRESYLTEMFRIDLAAKNSDKVLQILTLNLKDHPTDEKVRQNVIEFLLTIHKYDEALDVVNQGLNIHPESIKMLRGRVEIYEKLGRYDLAADDIKLLIQLVSTKLHTTPPRRFPRF